MSEKNFEFKTDEEYLEARNKFLEKHPEIPKMEDIECLNLIMRREYAEEILRGTKKLEYRSYSEFYTKRLIDKDMRNYIKEHIDDDEVMVFLNDIRQVKKIHFHNYNNSWFLDVECEYNDAFIVNEEGIEMLHNEYDCYDWDAELRKYDMIEEAGVETKRPVVFYFEIGKVIDTNLEVKPEEDEFVELCGGKTMPITPELINSKQDSRVITFRVDKGTFDEIKNGRRGVYTEEITPKNQSKFFQMNEDGAVKTVDGAIQYMPYNKIQFTYKDDSYTCFINNVDVVVLDDEYYELIPYSELDDDEVDYTDCMIAYYLGAEDIKS